jgi:hypothetical protein
VQQPAGQAALGVGSQQVPERLGYLVADFGIQVQHRLQVSEGG